MTLTRASHGSSQFRGLIALVALSTLFGLAQTGLGGVSTNYYRGEMSGWGPTGMQNVGGYWRTTILSDGDDSSSEFKFDASGAWTAGQQWARGATVTLATKDTAYANPGGNANFNEANGKYYTFTIKDENTGTDADHCIQETGNAPVTFSRSGEDSDSKHGINDPNTITVTTSASDPDEDIYIRYSTDGGSSWSEVKTEGSGATFTNDIPGQAQGTTVQYYTFSTTFAAVDTDTDLKTIRYDNNGYGNNTSYTIPTLGNCWHYPDNSEPSGTTMRNPTGTPASTGDLYIYSGSQFQGGNDANQTGGTVHHRKVGAAGWSTASLTYDTINGNNKYWYGTITSGTYSAGDDIEYYLKVEYSNRDTTYIGSTDGHLNSTTYEFEAPAQANTFKAFYAPDTSGAIWSEDFQGYADGTGTDGTGNIGDYPGSVSKWTLGGGTLSGSDNYFKTVSVSGDRRLEGQDVDTATTWTSENIDISLYTGVQFTLDAREDGDHSTADYLDVEYQVDAGGWTLIEDWDGKGSGSHTWITGESGSGDSGASTISVTQAVAGSSLDIRVTLDNSTGTKQHQIDNIIVTGTLAAPATPTGIKVTDTNATDFTVEWDEMASATNYAIDVSTSSTFQTPTGSGVHFNEIHADADTDNEFVELIAPFGTDLTGYKIVHYNGAATLDSDIFSHTIGSFTVPNDGITDENGTALGLYVLGEANITARDAAMHSNGLQNGPEGLGLYDASDTLLDFIGWDSDTGDINVDDPGGLATSGDTAAANYFGIVGDDDGTNSRQAPDAVRSSDGTGWTLAAATPGAINSGQTSGSIVLQAATPSYVTGYSNTLTGVDEEITVSGLTHSTTYYYRLRSMGTGGTSANSATKNVTTKAPASGGANATLSRTGGETANIAYTSYLSANIAGSGNAASVVALQIADGVSDSYTTEMTDLSLTVTGHANLLRAALYEGATEIQEVAVSGGAITFSGMSGANVTAADAGTKDLTLYVTFQTSVTDNEQLSFTVSSVSANGAGTTFTDADGGGAASDTSGDNNRIEVTATKLVLSGTPATVGISEDFSASVTAKDGLDNTDLDSTTSVTITQDGNNGTLTGGGATALTAGTHTFSALQVDGSGNFTITAADGSLTDATSGTITISELNVGDIYFTGFNANGDEDLAFVSFEDIPANTVLYFSTDEWDGSDFVGGTTDEQFSWHSGGSVLSAGTVVVLSALDSTGGRSASVGTLSGDATSINLNNDGVFCYYGTDADTPTLFLGAVGNGTEGGAFGTFTGTGLTDGETAMTLLGETEIGAYTNARAGFAKSAYKTMVADESNWAKEDPYNHGTPPDAPLDDTAFTFASLPSLSEGDVAFIAFNADGSDGFAIVALVEIPANANIYFTDNEWTDSPAGLVDSAEGALTWATGASAIPAGTVIRFELGGMTADYGTVSESDAGFDIGVDNDGILAFIGTADDDPSTFLAAVGNGTSAANCFGTLDGTGLTLGDTALIFGSLWDVAEYVATRNGEDAFADYRALITNTSNWLSQDDSGDQSADGTRPDAPFNDRSFRLGDGPTLFRFK